MSSSRAATGTPRPGDYFCDYKVSRQTVLKTSGEVDFVLRNFWDWTKYLGTAGECGLGMTGVWGGAPISAAFLLACADGAVVRSIR